MANLKNTTIDDTGFLKLPTGTTVQRPAAENARMRYNSSLNVVEYYDGNSSDWITTMNPAEFGTYYPNDFIAEGGKITQVDGYTIHTFEEPGVFKVVSGNHNIDYLIIAGGGGGGGGGSGSGPRGGGGAGGYIEGYSFTVSAGNYPITVGNGGVGGNEGSTGSEVNGTNGENSSALGFTATGGGAGPNCSPCQVGFTGGSGGGSSYSGARSGYVVGQGNPGGDAPDGGGGGGGAGQRGGTRPSTNSGGTGGYGLTNKISGMNLVYAGGGGAGGYPANNTNWGQGGLGGGGTGRTLNQIPGNGTFAIPHTGSGGGGGGGEGGPGSSGGSGIVIIRYKSGAQNTEFFKDRLVCHLDAGVSASYSGSGSTWTDLSGYNNNATITNVNFDSVTHGGVFNYNTSQYATLPTATINNLRTLDFTVGGMFYARSFTTDNYFRRLWCMGTSTSADLNLHVDTSGFLVLRFNNAVRFTSRWAMKLHQWYYVVLSRQRSGHRDNSPYSTVLYVNGEPWAIFRGTDDLNNVNSSSLSIGRHPEGNGRWDGFIGAFHVYKFKGLNRSEISQNYKYFENRFGKYDSSFTNETAGNNHDD